MESEVGIMPSKLAVVGNIDKVGPDYVLWSNGADKRRLNLADDWAMTKEDLAAIFHHHVGKLAAIPLDGPLFIAIDFMPGHFDGTVEGVPFTYSIASVERL
jgi:hypothetical protein